jgi:hypothetical protein
VIGYRCTLNRWHRVDNIREPATNVRSWYAPQLKRQGHDLLGEEVSWLRGRDDWIDLSLAPQGGQGERDEKLLIVGCKKETVPRRAAPAPCPPHALQERRDARWRANLDNAVEVADVESKLEGRGSDDDAVRLLCKSGSSSDREA